MSMDHGQSLLAGGGARFGRVGPLVEDSPFLRVGGHIATRRINLGSNPNTLENGTIVQVSPEGAFQPGQQVMFWLTVYNGPVGEGQGYISFVRLKPWWKRDTLEHRGPGDPGNQLPAGQGWINPDEQQFGSGPVAAPDATSSIRADNNRLVWFPVPKMLDVTQYQTPNPPAASPARQSDSLFLDDVWAMDLQDPGVAAYSATRGLTQPNFGRSAVFMYVSHGYALGLTHQFTITGGQIGNLYIDLTWAVGTL